MITVSERRQVNCELNLDELGGYSIDDVKCRACSGYGNCGYRQYRLHEGKPVLLCQLRKQELLGSNAQ